VSEDVQMEPPDNDDVTSRLAALDQLPVVEHVAVYDQLHRELRDQLVDGPGEPDAVAPSSA